MYHSFLKIIVYPAEYITHTSMYECHKFDNHPVKSVLVKHLSQLSPYRAQADGDSLMGNTADCLDVLITYTLAWISDLDLTHPSMKEIL